MLRTLVFVSFLFPVTPGFAQDESREVIIAATAEYLADLDRYFRASERRGARTLGQKARWIEQAADRIYDLHTVNVDDALVDYGLEVGDRLYNVARMYRDIGVRSGFYYREDNHYNHYWRFWNNRNFGRRITMGRDASDFFNEQRRWIKRNRADVRRQLTDEYDHQF